MGILGQWLVLLHIVAAFVMLSGVVGREFARAYALRQQKVEIFAQFMNLSTSFEQKLVTPGSGSLFVFGLLAAWLRGWPLFGFLQGSPINWLFVSLLLYLSILLMVFLILVPRGKLFGQTIAAALATGDFTPELRSAIADPPDRIGRIYSATVAALILYLMVMKPF